MRRVYALVAAALLGAAWATAAPAEDTAVATYHALTPALALKLARATQAACRGADYQVSVAVVDRGGLLQVLLRDQLAGNFTPEVAVRKAQTAAGFRQSTLTLAADLDRRAELRALHQVEEVLMVGGGVPVYYNGVVIGAVGVSGAPAPAADDTCAVAGISAIEEDLLF